MNVTFFPYKLDFLHFFYFNRLFVGPNLKKNRPENVKKVLKLYVFN